MAGRRGILWDFDGTLAHRTGLWSDLLVEALDLEDAGHGFEARAFRSSLSSGFPWHASERPHPEIDSPDSWWSGITDLLRRALLAGGVDPRRARRAAERARAEYLRLDRWRLYPDTLPTLDRLTEDGWRHVILSNHCPELPDLVDALGIADRFDAVLTSAVTGYEKPHSEAFALGRAALRNPRVLWMVGDNPIADLEGARQAGMHAILVRQPGAAGDDATGLEAAVAILNAGMRPPALRRGARVLLVDEADRVLLVRVTDPGSGRTFWATPGGGVEPGETFEAAARREVAEETGLTPLPLGACVWTREERGVFMGRPFHVRERIFFARVAAFQPSSDGYTELERQVQTEARWWTPAEVEASSETFAPTRFREEFARLLKGDPPSRPVDVGV